MSRRAAKFLIVGVILVIGLIGGWFIGQSPSEGPGVNSVNSSFTLVVPAFAQGIPADQFPMNEAGISTYVNVGQAINLEKAKPLFQVLEDATKNYVIGTVKLADHGEDFWPHAYIDKDGWILVYYPKDEPTSKLFQWVGYQRDVITTTTLRDVLFSLGRKLGLDVSKIDSDMHYYHFQYPDATKLLIVVDTISGSDSFQYTIPAGIAIYDASWSHHGVNISKLGSGGAWIGWSESKVDQAKLYRGGHGTYVICGSLGGACLTSRNPHSVEIGCNSGWAGIALVFIYR